MSTRPEYRTDFEGLLAFEETSPIRHECHYGRITTREDSSLAHMDINTNLMTAIGVRLRESPYFVLGSQQRIRTSETGTNWYYPDLLIARRPYQTHPRDTNALMSAYAIFEVLSPATAEFDRTDKFDEYKNIPEFADYILVSVDCVRIEHFQRAREGEWTHRVYRLLTQELFLENFGVSVPVAEIYEGIEVAEQGILPGMEES